MAPTSANVGGAEGAMAASSTELDLTNAHLHNLDNVDIHEGLTVRAGKRFLGGPEAQANAFPVDHACVVLLI